MNENQRRSSSFRATGLNVTCPHPSLPPSLPPSLGPCNLWRECPLISKSNSSLTSSFYVPSMYVLSVCGMGSEGLADSYRNTASALDVASRIRLFVACGIHVVATYPLMSLHSRPSDSVKILPRGINHLCYVLI